MRIAANSTETIEETEYIKISYKKIEDDFKMMDLEFYKNIFNKFKSSGYLIVDNFTNSHWILHDKDNTNGKKHLYFRDEHN